jgi:pyruvate/2-oxoglutarate dehydrogenase complex dihydrolipoamide dehydrogenase (E3) component
VGRKARRHKNLDKRKSTPKMTYDAIVIGSGQAGNPLSYTLAHRGWKIALIEEAHLGGTCINTGCTPTKTMLASAQIAHYARNSSRWGVVTQNVRIDLPAVVARKDKVVQSFRFGQHHRIEGQPNVRLCRGHATFVSSSQVEVNNETLESKRIFIDTGARTEVPPLDGLDSVPFLTNETILQLKDLPQHLLVLGGGYIGLEFGQMFRRFGSRVTIVHRGEQVLGREDPDVTGELQKALTSEGIEFRLNAQASKTERTEGGISVSIDSPQGNETLSATHLLVATGRKPNTDKLGLDRAGVETDEHGYIKVNEFLETTAPGIWALGDVKGGPAFTHISYNDYQIVFANVAEGKKVSTANRYVPYSLFTDPQLGRVGLTEKQARQTGRKLKIGAYPMANVARAIERDEAAGMMKLIVDAATDRILGAAILATEGGELIQILGALMLADAPYTVLKDAVYIHPTLAEGFFGLMDAVKPVT